MSESGLRSGERFVSASELQGRVRRAAQALADVGVNRGDSVGVLLRNDIAFFEAQMAAGRLGAYAVPINWHFKPDEVAYILGDAAPKALVAHTDLLRRLGPVPDGVTPMAVAVPPEVADAYGVAEEEREPTGGVIDWDEAVAASSPWDGPEVVAPSPMVYTSGSTGRPKGVRRSADTPIEQLRAATRNFVAALALETGARTVVTGPLYHSAPNAYAMLTLRLQGLVVLQSRFEPEDLLRLIEHHQATHLHLVPTMFVRLLRLDAEVRRSYDLSSIRSIVHGAAPCPPDIKRAMIEWVGPCISEYYGATETGAVAMCTSEEWLERPGTVGRPLPSAEVRVYGEDGAEAPTNCPGEIYVRVAGFSDFTYMGNDAARAEVERDGLVTCGDVGYVDEAGYLFLCDRKRDMVISGGVNIYPTEIEGVLLALGGVRDCAVFGIPDDEFGEVLAAVVELEPGADLDEEAVRAHIRERLASYKTPRVVQFTAALPREDSGKVFKRKLRDPFWESAGRAI